MGRHTTEIRIHGASAPQVLAAIVRGLPPDADVVLDGMLTIAIRGRASHLLSLGTRADGVVCLTVEDGGVPLVGLPPACVVYQHTSCCRGIDHESLDVVRGEVRLLGVSESPDGDLSVTIDDEEVVAIRRAWDPDGNRVPAPGDDVTWRSLVERHLPGLEARLGPAAVVLREGAATLEPRVSPAVFDPESDDIPF